MALEDLPALRDAYIGYEDQLQRGAEMLALCQCVPCGVGPMCVRMAQETGYAPRL